MSERNYGILGTIIIHNIIILLLIFSYLSMPKPSTTEGSILINFGDIPYAGGPDEPRLNNEPQQQNMAASQPQSEASKDEDYMTQNNEDAPAITKSTEKKKAETKPKTTATSTNKTTAKKNTEPVQQVNTKALYTGKGKSTTESGTSQGVYTGPGNMGSPTGTPESNNYSSGLGGDNIVLNLNGRSFIHMQTPEFNIQKEGIVVVEVTVDRTGKVMSATPGIKGSTIVDNTLYAAAKKAALESKFNVKNDAPDRQIGTITYHFKLE